MVRAHLPWESRPEPVRGGAPRGRAAGTAPHPRRRRHRGRPRSCSAPRSSAPTRGAARAPPPLRHRRLGGIWDVDLHAEVALRTGNRLQPLARGRSALPPEDRFEPYTPEGSTPRGGGRRVVVEVQRRGRPHPRGRVLLQRRGYEDARLYPVLLYAQVDPEFFLGTGAQAEPWFTPFYLGRTTRGVLLLPAPGRGTTPRHPLRAREPLRPVGRHPARPLRPGEHIPPGRDLCGGARAEGASSGSPSRPTRSPRWASPGLRAAGRGGRPRLALRVDL